MAKTKTAPKENNEIVILSQFDHTKAELSKLAADYANLVVSEENFKDALKARSTIRDYRYAIQNRQKSNDALRVEWSKKVAKDNEANARELIEILLEVENPLDAQIKAIEAVKEEEKKLKEEQEKARIESRIAKITDSGAVIIEGGYLLAYEGMDDLFISNEEINSLGESVFISTVGTFEVMATKICERKIEADKLAARTDERKKELFNLGYGFNGNSYSHSLLPSLTPFSETVIANYGRDEWREAVNAAADLIEESKESIRFQKEKEEAERIEFQRIEFEQKERQAAMQREREEIEKEKTKLKEEKIKARQKQLFGFGMSASSSGFVFESASISREHIENANGDEWEKTIAFIHHDIANIKKEQDRIREAELLEKQTENERKRISDKKIIDEENKKRKDFLLEIPELEKLRNKINAIQYPELESELGKSLLLQVGSFMNDALCLIDEKIQ